MSKARDLADLMSAGGILQDSQIAVDEVSGLTATATELNYMSGVTSAVQTQLTAKAPVASPTFTGTVTTPAINLNGSDVATSLAAKAPIASPTFTGTLIAPTLDVTGNAVIEGNLTVNGTTVTVSASDLAISDNMIYMNQGVEADVTDAVGDGNDVVYTADNNYTVGMSVTVTGATPSSFNVTNATITAADSTTFTIEDTNVETYTSGGTARAKTNVNPDLGFAAGYNDGSYGHAGLFRDATDGVWKFFDSYTPEPDESVFIDTSHASFNIADIQAGTATVTDLDTTSDVRLKDNIVTIENALDKASALRGVNYNWIASGEYTMGVVAQEVQEVIPEVVTEKSDGTLTVNYQAMVGLLIEAVKELKEELDRVKEGM